MKLATPFDLWKSAYTFGAMMAEAQAVITLRVMGLAGGWNLGPGGKQRMVSEMAAALQASGLAVARAMMMGANPIAVAGAAVAPVRRRTRANARRLARRGAF
jgi:hypothetical protein